MSGRRDESLPLDEILDASSRLIELGARTPPGMLGLDRDINEMVMFNLLKLGEASKRLRPETRVRFSDVDWSAMARIRDRVAHHYEQLNWVLVSEIIEEDLPALVPRLAEIRDLLRAEFDAQAGEQ